MGKQRRAKIRISKKARLERLAEQSIYETARLIAKGEVAKTSESERVLAKWLIKFFDDADTLRISLLTITLIAKLKPEHRTATAKTILKDANDYLLRLDSSALAELRASLKKLGAAK